MLLPEPEYISIQEASEKFKLSTEHLQWLGENGFLPVYVKALQGKYPFAKLTTPRWYMKELDLSLAIVIDETGTPINETMLTQKYMYSIGNSFQWIFVKTQELLKLSQKFSDKSNRNERSMLDAVEWLCNQLKTQGLKYNEIAKRLKHEFPTLTPYRIGVLLPANPGRDIKSSGHRKRGSRLLTEK